MEWLVLLFGLCLLLGGGELLVRGATSLARRLGVSSMVIGMTVVAFGTSAPELGVNVAAALRGQTAITFGNVVGSNIANIGLILGLTAVISALDIHRSIVTREIPIMFLATFAMVVFGVTHWFGGPPGAISSQEGLWLLLGFFAFLIVTARSALKSRREDPFVEEAAHEQKQHAPLGWAFACLFTVAGLAAVLYGSHETVRGATGVAQSLGLSESVIGLTIVAIGTSLPELTTSIFSALKGNPDLTIGNIVGSNVFNLLFVLGVSSSLHSVAIPEWGGFDLIVLSFFTLVLIPLAWRQRRITRAEGLFLLALYVGYLFWRPHL